MVSISQEIDISQMFNHFAQKKCINHQKRKASSVCLYEDCWKLESDNAFFCVDCNVEHIKKHGNSLRFDSLFTDELFDEFDEYVKNANKSNKLKERISKFDQKINELHIEIEQWTRCQFTELKRFFESYLRENLNIDQAIENLKQMLSEAKRDLILNYKFKEKVKSYCIKMEKIQKDFNDIMNDQVIGDSEKKDDKMDLELDSKLQKMGNFIKENIKNQVNQLNDNLIGFTKKNKSLKNKFLMEEKTRLDGIVLKPKVSLVKKSLNMRIKILQYI